MLYESFIYPSHVVAIFSITTPIYVVLIHNFRQKAFQKIYIGGSTLGCGAGIIKAQSSFGRHLDWFVLMQVAGCRLPLAFGYRDWKK